MASDSELARRDRTRRLWPLIRPWLGVGWIVCGTAMVSVSIWGALDGDLTAPDPSNRFQSWSRLGIGILLFVLGLVWLVLTRRESLVAKADEIGDPTEV